MEAEEGVVEGSLAEVEVVEVREEPTGKLKELEDKQPVVADGGWVLVCVDSIR